jgi:hypothetical protein
LLLSLPRLQCAIIGCEQSLANEITRGTGPGFVGIATHVGARHRQKTAGMNVAQIHVNIEGEILDLLHHAGDFEIAVYLLRQFANFRSHPPHACKLL